MNNPNQFGQQPQPGRPVPPPPPGAPRPPVNNSPFSGENTLALVGAVFSFASIAIGLLSAAMTFPIYDLILNIIALLMGGAGVAMSIVGGNQNVARGVPRGIISTLGFIFGIVGVLVCLAALGWTGCLTCITCKAGTSASSILSYLR